MMGKSQNCKETFRKPLSSSTEKKEPTSWRLAGKELKNEKVLGLFVGMCIL